MKKKKINKAEYQKLLKEVIKIVKKIKKLRRKESWKSS